MPAAHGEVTQLPPQPLAMQSQSFQSFNPGCNCEAYQPAAARKRKVYAAYVAMETALGEMERAREIFTVWVARDPTNGAAFAAFADLETRLGETARARGVLETAVSVVPQLREAEVVWQRLGDVVASEGGGDALAMRRFDSYVETHESAVAWLRVRAPARDWSG